MQPQGSIFQNGFLGEVQFKFDLTGVVIKLGLYYYLDWWNDLKKCYFLINYWLSYVFLSLSNCPSYVKALLKLNGITSKKNLHLLMIQTKSGLFFIRIFTKFDFTSFFPWNIFWFFIHTWPNFLFYSQTCAAVRM